MDFYHFEILIAMLTYLGKNESFETCNENILVKNDSNIYTHTSFDLRTVGKQEKCLTLTMLN